MVLGTLAIWVHITALPALLAGAGQGVPDARKYITRPRGKLATAFGEPILEDGVLSVFRVER